MHEHQLRGACAAIEGYGAEGLSAVPYVRNQAPHETRGEDLEDGLGNVRDGREA